MRGSSYLSALAQLHQVADAEERRRLWRQGLAAVVARAELGPAPLEGLDPDDLLRSTRIALADGLLRDLDWLSPAAAAIAQLELAAALPQGPERRELGRRVAARLRDGDRETFVVLATALALSSPRALDTAAVRSRLEVVLAAPLTAPGGVGPVALALVSRPDVADTWLVRPSTGALRDRRLAARLIAHAAREAVRRGGDRADVFALPAVAEATRRLLSDREALVWRFAAVARGLLAHARSDTAAEIEHELAIGGEPLRRAGTSAAAALERGGIALRWRPALLGHAEKDGAIARAVIQGLAGLAVTDPSSCDAIVTHMVGCGGLDAVEALADLLREEGDLALPAARAAASTWIDGQLRGAAPPKAERLATSPLYNPIPAPPQQAAGTPPKGAKAVDESRLALLQLIRQDLARATTDGFAVQLGQVKAELDAGQLAPALRHARAALDEVAAAVDWLERSSDDDAMDRRHALRVLRDLDREVLSEGTLRAALALVADADPAPAALAAILARLEAALLDREREAELGSAVADYRLRLARLRALIRLLDGDVADADGERRLATVRALMTRAAADRSPLRRAVWAAMTRTWDALLRAGELEVTDLVLVLASSFEPDEDFAIAREATMVPAVERALDGYRGLLRAVWAASDPDDEAAVLAAVDALAELARSLPRAASPRVEAVRTALAELATLLDPVVRATGMSGIPPATFDELGGIVAGLALAVAGARRRTGLSVPPVVSAAAAIHAVGLAIERIPAAAAVAAASRSASASEASPGCDYEVASAVEAVRAELPHAVAELIGRVLTRVARLPAVGAEVATMVTRGATLPAWLPLSRRVGGFYVERPIGTGGGGSVFVAVRSDDRGRPDAEPVALKVPDYDGAAARSLSEQEFETMFREEAGALLALPRHPNLAGFVTFDAGARPKPILVMELVTGPTLERALERGNLDAAGALAIVDGIAAGLEVMHAARVAHLDLKPQNVILRQGAGHGDAGAARLRPVLVDFGLAGRTLRPGCGSPHYGAPEVWVDRPRGDGTVFAADVYAFACLAFEVLTNRVLIDGPTLQAILGAHIAGKAGGAAAMVLAGKELGEVGTLLGAALATTPEQRPTIARLRAGFAAVAPAVAKLRWPLAGA